MPVGIIAEYNPFHIGHQYQVQAARKAAEAAGIRDSRTIVVMSGNYVQRGVPALLDKYTRTKMALRGGASLVIELPTLYSTATAEWFAYGGVDLLMRSTLVDAISFGCEDPDDAFLPKAAELLAEEPALYKALLKDYLDTGLPFAKARQLALETCLGEPLSTLPNQILALEYRKAAIRIADKTGQKLPVFLPIKREGSSHDSDTAVDGMASATFIRSLLLSGDTQAAEDLLPASTVCEIQPLLSAGTFPFVSEEALFPALRYALANKTLEELAQIDEVSEGLENRILEAASQAVSYRDLLAKIHTKRYPESRIRRILLNAYLDITHEKKDQLAFTSGPSYLRVLGCRKGDEDLLSSLSAASTLPTILRPADDMAALPEIAQKAFNEELRFGRLYRTLSPLQPASELSARFIRI